jgi:outer membrane protein TolC
VVKRRSKLLFTVFVFLFALRADGQSSQDTLLIGEREFLRQVLLYHPMLITEELEVERANQEVQANRAAFDPAVYADWMNKDFDDKNYYNYQNAALSWQLPPGIKVKAGAERNSGQFINPEFNTPAEGLLFAEVAVPIGDGLFRTEDQTKLQKSRIDADAAVSMLELRSRYVVYDAADLYWNWFATTQDLALREEIRDLAAVRRQQILTRFRQGLATGMDTLEAHNLYLQREADFLKTRQLMEVWYQGAGNLIWDASLYREYRLGRLAPDSTWTSDVSQLSQLNRSPLINPAVELAAFKVQTARLDRLLAREQIKPDIYLKGKALSTRGETLSVSGDAAVFGFSAYFPLISRKERAKLKMANIKLQQLEIQLSAYERELMLRFEQLNNQLAFLEQELELVRQNVENTRELLRMENKRMLFGESTLLLVNLRETNYIAAQMSYISIQKKRVMLEWKLALLTYSPEELLF